MTIECGRRRRGCGVCVCVCEVGTCTWRSPRRAQRTRGAGPRAPARREGATAARGPTCARTPAAHRRTRASPAARRLQHQPYLRAAPYRSNIHRPFTRLKVSMYKT